MKAILQVADTIYKGIPDLPNYQVGTDGSIWSRSSLAPLKESVGVIGKG